MTRGIPEEGPDLTWKGESLSERVDAHLDDTTYDEASKSAAEWQENWVKDFYNSPAIIQHPLKEPKYQMLPAEKAAYRMAMMSKIVGTISWIAFLIAVVMIFRVIYGS